ncbi:MAG: hypothetical protein IPM12_15635 [Flavobacteriales bacterium]|nr:hypothetical protein [Flavobacteriales bacterium]
MAGQRRAQLPGALTANDPSIGANAHAIGYTTRGSHQVTDLESKGQLVLRERHWQRR